MILMLVKNDTYFEKRSSVCTCDENMTHKIKRKNSL